MSRKLGLSQNEDETKRSPPGLEIKLIREQGIKMRFLWVEVLGIWGRISVS
jgi:hypothetical protein